MRRKDMYITGWLAALLCMGVCVFVVSCSVYIKRIHSIGGILVSCVVTIKRIKSAGGIGVSCCVGNKRSISIGGIVVSSGVC